MLTKKMLVLWAKCHRLILWFFLCICLEIEPHEAKDIHKPSVLSPGPFHPLPGTGITEAGQHFQMLQFNFHCNSFKKPNILSLLIKHLYIQF